MRIVLLTILFSFLLCSLSAGQGYLVLKKRGKVVATFKEGDQMRFKLKGERFYYNHMITGFGVDKIKFNYFDLHIDEVGVLHVKNPKKNIASIVSVAGIQGGVFFLLIDQFNQVIVNGDEFGPSDQTWIISGGLIATGLLAKLFIKKKFKINGLKYQLEVR